MNKHICLMDKKMAKNIPVTSTLQKMNKQKRGHLHISRFTSVTEEHIHRVAASLRGRRSKGKGKGIRARDHARGTPNPNPNPNPPSSRAPRVLSRLKFPFPKLPFPSLSNACHAGYVAAKFNTSKSCGLGSSLVCFLNRQTHTFQDVKSDIINQRQETIKGTERASPIYTLFHR